jgi:hypothetical protein
MDQLMGTQDYSQAASDPRIKQASTGIDRLLEATGAPEAGEKLGRSIGSALGNEER